MAETKMVRRQLYVSATLNKDLKEWSRRLKVSESEILRQALTIYLQQEKRRQTPLQKNPVLKAQGVFNAEKGLDNARQILARFSDHPITLADATSAAILQIEKIPIATFDRYFRLIGVFCYSIG